MPLTQIADPGEGSVQERDHEQSPSGQAAFQLVASLLDAVDRPLLGFRPEGPPTLHQSSRAGLIEDRGFTGLEFNLFPDILNTDRAGVLSQLEAGEQEVSLLVESPAGRSRARVRWLPEPDWLVGVPGAIAFRGACRRS